MKLNVKKLDQNALFPSYDSPRTESFTLFALDDVTIHERSLKLIRTGLSIEIPEGYELEVRMRPILAIQTKLRIPDGMAIFDSSNNGKEVSFYFENTNKGFSEDFRVKRGQKIAFARLRKVEKVEFNKIDL